MQFLSVFEHEDSAEPVEIPIEEDGTVLHTTLAGQFPRVCGLKYRPTGSMATFRAVRLSEGRFYKPVESVEGHWNTAASNRFICVFPKETDNKRKCEEQANDSVLLPKTKRMEGCSSRKCTDLIVLNLGWKVDEDTLRKYFTKFGDLVLLQIKRDRESQQSRGYAFIRYDKYESQVLCLAEQHLIDGRWCAVKIPFSKNEADKQEISKKVHVAYTSEDITMEDLRSSFEEYGYVTDIFIPKPFRNFAFITFDSSDSVQALIGRSLVLKGHTLTIGSAVPKINNNNNIINNNKKMLQQQQQHNILMYPPDNSNSSTEFAGSHVWLGYDNNNGSNMRHQQQYDSNRSSSSAGLRYSGLLPNPHIQQQQQQQQYIFSNNSNISNNNNRAEMMMMSYNGFQQQQQQHTDMGQNTAAMAALNILNNPGVVAAIVAAANKSSVVNSHHNNRHSNSHHQYHQKFANSNNNQKSKTAGGGGASAGAAQQ